MSVEDRIKVEVTTAILADLSDTVKEMMAYRCCDIPEELHTKHQILNEMTGVVMMFDVIDPQFSLEDCMSLNMLEVLMENAIQTFGTSAEVVCANMRAALRLLSGYKLNAQGDQSIEACLSYANFLESSKNLYSLMIQD